MATVPGIRDMYAPARIVIHVASARLPLISSGAAVRPKERHPARRWFSGRTTN